jgi:hypothetical protein
MDALTSNILGGIGFGVLGAGVAHFEWLGKLMQGAKTDAAIKNAKKPIQRNNRIAIMIARIVVGAVLGFFLGLLTDDRSWPYSALATSAFAAGLGGSLALRSLLGIPGKKA